MAWHPAPAQHLFRSAAPSCSGEDGHQIRDPQHDVVRAIGALELAAGILGVQDGAPRGHRQRAPLAFIVQGTWANRYDLSPTKK